MKLLNYFIVFVCLSLVSFAGYAKGLFDTSIKPADVNYSAYCAFLKGKRVALIINQTAKVRDSSLLDVLLVRGVLVAKIFVPEHGFRGKEDAGAKIESGIDSATGVKVISLYGSHKKPLPEDLVDIDVMVYDLQDVGVRFYTYISTLEYCMEACAQQKKQFVVLDRPNPNGFYVDGPVLEVKNKSFVGMQRIPVVYGMTVGEYAGMIKGEHWFSSAADLDLKVIKCIKYNHRKLYQLPVAPSPNLRNMAAVYAYPSLCLFEGTKVSVGRGTDLPFQQYGCPDFRDKFTYEFTPVSVGGAKNPLYEYKTCYGELLGSTPEEVLQQIDNKFQLKWLIKAYAAYPDKEHFFNDFFVKLAGIESLKQQIIDNNKEPFIRKSWGKELIAFKKIRKKYLLYTDFE